MKIWKVGEKSKGLCEHCDRLVSTTYEPRTVDLEQSGLSVRDVLVAVCEVCDAQVSIPYQSTPRLAEEREKASSRLEVRIPHHLEDALFLMSATLKTTKEQVFPLLLMFYANRAEAHTTWIQSLESDELLTGRKDCRLSLRLGESRERALTTAISTWGLRSRSSIVSRVILAGVHDVLNGESKSRQDEIIRSANAVG